jgi:hypothetical protein
MATGTRLLLVDSSGSAGDIRLILLTLGVLQAYEWAVGGILLGLHTARRSPEDKPSLLLVAVLFWTGPLAATVEMTALRPTAGAALAAGAAVIAVGELRLICRALALQITPAGRLIGTACLTLLVAAAPLLTIPEGATGTNELYLYGAWWVLGGITLGCLWVARVYRRQRRGSGPPEQPDSLGLELGFLVVTITATAAHLIGMNHAFFCHAALFYYCPLILAVSVVGMEFIPFAPQRGRVLLVAFAALPAVAILLSLLPFDSEVPLTLLPWWVRDPILGIFVAAAAAWWFGYLRHRAIVLMHAANAALGLAVLRVGQTLSTVAPVSPPPGAGLLPSHGLWPVVLYGIVGYFLLAACLRRSRVEALAALAANQLAIVLLVWDRTQADTFILCLVAGWSLLVALHLMTKRPRLRARAVLIAFLAIAPWICDYASSLRWQAGGHAVMMILILLVVGQVWRWTHYRAAAAFLAVAHLVVAAGWWTTQSTHPAAVATVGVSFALLICGGTISWCKRRLLDAIHGGGADRSPGRADGF